MNFALNANQKLISIETWLRDEVSSTTGSCSICGDTVYVKCENSSQKRPHFSHLRKSSCQSKIPGGGNLNRFERNFLDESKSRSSLSYFLENIESINQQIVTIFPEMTQQHMYELLKKAKRQKMWNINNLEPNHIPYVLLACGEYFSGKDIFGRHYKYRFYFEAFVDQKEPDEISNAQYLTKANLSTLEINKYKVINSLKSRWDWVELENITGLKCLRLVI